MKVTFLLIAIFFNQFAGFGQSPFNYGQNRNVYFISSELRDTLGLEVIYTIDQQKDGELGGMYENWDVTAIRFDGNTISDYWAPISKDSSYKFDFYEMTDSLYFLNGTDYELDSDRLVAYGGSGYGTFDLKQVEFANDTISIISTSCVGHCGGNANTSYSKNVFNKQRQLLYTVFYPGINDSITYESGDIDMADTLASYEDYLLSLMSEANIPDTVYYKYDDKGLLLNDGRGNTIKNIAEVKKLFTDTDKFTPGKFHQCYVGETKMEKYIKRKLGFIPELVLIEIYGKGVLSFVMNSVDKKYYQANAIILEQ